MKKFLILFSLLMQSCVLPNTPKDTITAHGVGQVIANPDIAKFYFTVSDEADDANVAQQKMAQKAQKAIIKLKLNNIEDNDIKTTSYNTHPKYSRPDCDKFGNCHSSQVVAGYKSSETFLVKVRDIKKAGEILSAISQYASEVSGLTFEIDDMEKIKAKAKEEAIKKAKEDAAMIAKNLGIKLGKVTAYYEEDQNYVPYRTEMAMSAKVKDYASVAAPIQSGEKNITYKVSITYRIK